MQKHPIKIEEIHGDIKVVFKGEKVQLPMDFQAKIDEY